MTEVRDRRLTSSDTRPGSSQLSSEPAPLCAGARLGAACLLAVLLASSVESRADGLEASPPNPAPPAASAPRQQGAPSRFSSWIPSDDPIRLLPGEHCLGRRTYSYPDATSGCQAMTLSVRRAMIVADPSHRHGPGSVGPGSVGPESSGPGSSGAGKVRSSIDPPDVSKAQASRYIEAAQKAGACFDHPPSWSSCPDIPTAAFGYTPDRGGIDLNRLQKGDAFDAAVAYMWALNHTNTHTSDDPPTVGPRSYNAYVFINRGHYPEVDEIDPSAGRPSSTAGQRFDGAWFVSAVFAIPLLGLSAWSAWLGFRTKERFGLWPHDKLGKNSKPPLYGIGLGLASVLCLAIDYPSEAFGFAAWSASETMNCLLFFRTTARMGAEREHPSR